MRRKLKSTYKLVEENWRISLSVVICIAIFMSAASIQFGRISKFMPYSQHIDEHWLTDRAANILKTGDYNPHFFGWSSWPIYLTAASMTVGYLYAASTLDLKQTDEIGSVSFPFYTHPKILWAPKILFVLLGLTAAFLMGFVGYRLSNQPFLLFLIPLSILLSRFYSGPFLSYPNPDTVGVFSIACLYLFLFSRKETGFSLRSAAIIGALTGMVIASKYSLFLVFVPSLILMVTQKTKRLVIHASVLAAAAAFTFLILVPFSFLDLSGFLDGLGFQLNHYSGGHPGFDGPAGIQQLRYYLAGMMGDFGLGTVPFFLLGTAAMIRVRPGQILAFFSFPVLHLLFFATKPVHFTRNVVFVYVCYAFFAAVGVTVLYGLVRSVLEKTKLLSTSTATQLIGAFAVVLISFVVCFPIDHPFELARIQPDSRKQAVSWIQDNVEHGTHLVVAKELLMDTRELSNNYIISSPLVSEMSQNQFRTALRQVAGGYVLLPVFGFSGSGKAGSRRFSEWADEINQFSEDLVIEHRFEGSKSTINWAPRWAHKSPDILIGTIDTRAVSLDVEPSENTPNG